MVKVGDTVYLWCHAYLRLVGKVTAIHGSRRVALEDASKILSDGNGDEAFFESGHKAAGVSTAFIGDVPDVAYLGAFAYRHPLPEPKNPRKK